MESAAVIRRRLRRRVADEKRKRAPKACHRCKARKSKCIATPLGKCQRCLDGALACDFDRHPTQPKSPMIDCHHQDRSSTTVTPAAPRGPRPTGPSPAALPSSTSDPTERFMWPSFLSRLRETFSLGPPPPGREPHPDPAAAAAAASRPNQPPLSTRVSPAVTPSELRRLRAAVEAFPPRPVADFLLNVCINHATDSFFYFDQAQFLAEIDEVYTDPTSRLGTDASFICLVHASLALGSQWTTLARPHDMPAQADVDPGIIFYRRARALLPDIVESSSLRAVSALFILGVYALPASSIGSGYVYLGLALRKALALDLHQNNNDDPNLESVDGEIRRRLWWAIFSLERSTTVKLSRPRSVMPSSITTPLPRPLSSLDDRQKFNNVHQQLANAQLMKILDRIAETDCAGADQPWFDGFAAELKAWKRSLPGCLAYETVDPRSSAYRANVHLSLNYYFSWISMGKFCVVNAVRAHLRRHLAGSGGAGALDDHEGDLLGPPATSCIKAAAKILRLFEHLKRSGNLTRFSFTDFQGCSIALIVVLLAGILERDSSYHGRVTFAFDCLRRMVRGNAAAEMGVAFVVALQSMADEAVEKLREAAAAAAAAASAAAAETMVSEDVDPVATSTQQQQQQTTVAAGDYQGWMDWLAGQNSVLHEQDDDVETDDDQDDSIVAVPAPWAPALSATHTNPPHWASMGQEPTPPGFSSWDGAAVLQQLSGPSSILPPHLPSGGFDPDLLSTLYSGDDQFLMSLTGLDVLGFSELPERRRRQNCLF